LKIGKNKFRLSRPRPHFPARSRSRPAQPASRAPARRSRPGPRPRPPSSSRARPRNAGRRGRARSPRVGHALPPLAARRPRPDLPPARAHSKRLPEPPRSLTSPPSLASHPSSPHRAVGRLAAASSGFASPFRHRQATTIKFTLHRAPPRSSLLRTSLSAPSLPVVGLLSSSPRRATATVPTSRASPPPQPPPLCSPALTSRVGHFLATLLRVLVGRWLAGTGRLAVTAAATSASGTPATRSGLSLPPLPRSVG
jgi:hypothetical protein